MDKDLPVAIRKCSLYERNVIMEIVDAMALHLGFSKRFHGQVILLKPNLISADGPVFSCTHAEFIAGVASWFLDHGARVVLGDSPAFGTGKKVCEKHGIVNALKGMNVQFVEFATPVTMELADGMTIQIAREALECDLFVGLPKIKAHNQMYVTMALKNIFGVVKGVNKAMLHMRHGKSHDHFAGIILNLLQLLPNQLHIADGIEVMHQSGPLNGNSLSLCCVAGATSPVALDTVLLHLLELKKEKCPLWRVASARKLKGTVIDDINFTDLYPCDFAGSGFIAPSILDAIRFNPLKFILGMVKRIFVAA